MQRHAVARDSAVERRVPVEKVDGETQLVAKELGASRDVRDEQHRDGFLDRRARRFRDRARRRGPTLYVGLQRRPALEPRFARDDFLSLAERKLELQRFYIREIPIPGQATNAAANRVVSFAMPAHELLGELSISFESGHGAPLLTSW